jgi:hypothetical protein
VIDRFSMFEWKILQVPALEQVSAMVLAQVLDSVLAKCCIVNASNTYPDLIFLPEESEERLRQEESVSEQATVQVSAVIVILCQQKKNTKTIKSIVIFTAGVGAGDGAGVGSGVGGAGVYSFTIECKQKHSAIISSVFNSISVYRFRSRLWRLNKNKRGN